MLMVHIVPASGGTFYALEYLGYPGLGAFLQPSYAGKTVPKGVAIFAPTTSSGLESYRAEWKTQGGYLYRNERAFFHQKLSGILMPKSKDYYSAQILGQSSYVTNVQVTGSGNKRIISSTAMVDVCTKCNWFAALTALRRLFPEAKIVRRLTLQVSVLKRQGRNDALFTVASNAEAIVQTAGGAVVRRYVPLKGGGLESWWIPLPEFPSDPIGYAISEYCRLHPYLITESRTTSSGTLKQIKCPPWHPPSERLLLHFCQSADEYTVRLTGDSEARRAARSSVSMSIGKQATGLDINSLMYLYEGVKMGAQLATIAAGTVQETTVERLISDLDSNASDFRLMARYCSQVQLAGSYGLNLTVKDTSKILDVMVKNCRRLKHEDRIARSQTVYTESSSQAFTRVRENYKCFYRNTDTGLAGILNDLYNMDAMLTTQNVWDMIPFSFVVDWFADVESYCDQVDMNGRLAALPIRFVLVGQLKIVDLSAEFISKRLEATGFISMEQYNRSGQRTLPTVYPQFSGVGWNPSIPNATALVAQYAEKFTRHH